MGGCDASMVVRVARKLASGCSAAAASLGDCSLGDCGDAADCGRRLARDAACRAAAFAWSVVSAEAATWECMAVALVLCLPLNDHYMLILNSGGDSPERA